MLTWIRKIIKPPVLENDEEALAASLLHKILIIFGASSFIVPLLLNLIAILNPGDEIPFEIATLVMGLIVPALALGLLELMHRGQLRLASIAMTGTLFLLTTFTIISFRGTRDTALSMYILVIAMAGLMLGGQAAILFVILSLLATLGIFFAEATGRLDLTVSETPEIIEWIIFAVIVVLIGVLLRFAFETLTNAFRRARDANDELATMQSSLAERVAARTKDLELAGEIGRYLSRVQESEGILLEAVELIRSRFELYYTQIYLVDTARNNLVLRSGTGAVGHQLRQLGHRLPINGSSINGTAVINKKPVIVSDTTISPIFRQNPLLPETRSEMSVPLIISDNVVGILNLQSVIPNSLTEENLPAFEALAGQLAVALDNARLFSEAAEAQSSVVSLAQRLTRSSWESYLNAIDRQESISFTYDNTQTEFVDGPIDMKNRTSFSVPIRLGGENLGKIEILGNEWDSWGPEDKELAAAIGQRVAQQIENLRLFSETERYRTEAEEATRRLVREGWDSYIEEQETGTDGFQYDQERVTPFPANGQNGKKEANFVQALTVRGEEIGHFEIEGISGSDEEVSDLVGAVAERLSAHIENLRLANQTENALRSTERRAEELAVVNRIAQVISQAMDLDLMLGVILEEISKILPVDAFIVGLYDEEADLLEYPLVYDDGQRYQIGFDKPLPHSTVYQVLKSHEPQILLRTPNEVAERAEKARPTMVGNQTKVSASLMYVPLSQGNRSTGVVSVQSYEFNAYRPDDLTLLVGIASYVAVALENARLFEETQAALAQTEKQAARLEVLNEIGTMLSVSTSEQEVFQIVGRETGRLIESDRVSIALLTDDGQWMDFYALNGDEGTVVQGRKMAVEGTAIETAVLEKRIVSEGNLADSSHSDSRQLAESGLSSSSIAPLIASGQVIGTFNIGSTAVDAFDETDKNILRQAAALIASTIESRRLFGETEQRAEELSVVNQVALVVSQMLEMNELYSAVHEQIQRAIVSDAFFVAIYNEEENTINFPYLFDDGDHYILDPISANPELEVVQVIETGEPIMVNYGALEEAERATPNEALLATEKVPTSMIFVPLRSGLKPVGAISVQNYQAHNYTKADVDLLSGIAYPLAIALENARLFSETEKRAEELAVINQIAQAVSGKTEQDELLQTVFEQVQRIMSVDAFSATAYDARTGLIHYLMVMDEGRRFEEAPTPLGTGAVSQVIRQGKPILFNRTKAELDELARKQEVILIGNLQRFSASMIYVPLQIGAETIGGLSVQSYEFNAYGQSEVDLLVGVANHVAVALENSRLFEATQSTLAETELLYNIGTHINQAATLDDLVNVVGIQGIANEADSAGLFRFELDENGQAEWMELAANWIGKGESVLPTGTRLHLPEIPLAAAELYTPNEPMLISNIAEDDRVDEEAKALLQGLNTKAVAIIPMQQLDVWIGTLIIRWKEIYNFGSQEQRLYNSLARQLSTALSNQLLLTETQNRAAQLEKIALIETALSQAQDEVGILDALALVLEESQAASIHYAVEEDNPVSAFTVGHWENGQIQPEDEMLYRPFDIELHAGLALGVEQPDRITTIVDIQSDERIGKTAANEAKQMGFRSIVVIPLRSAGRWQGFISIKWPKRHEFTRSEIAVWEQLRESLAAIIASRRAYLAQQEALSETAVLYETGAQLSIARSYDSVLSVLRNNTILGQNISNVSIMLFEHDWQKDDKPAYADVLTFWSEIAPDQAKTRFYFNHYPSSDKILDEAKQAHIFSDVPNSSELDENLKNMLVKGFNTQTFVLFPMIVRGNWIGYVNAMYPEPITLSEKDIRRTEAIIQQAGVAVQGLRNLDQAEQQALEARSRSNELAILNEMGRSLTALVDMDTILENVYRYTARLMDATNFYISFFDAKRNEIIFALDIRGEEVFRNVGTRKAGRGLTEHIIYSKAPLLIPENVDDKLDELGLEKIGPTTSSWLGVPLMVGSQVIGVIGVQHWHTPRTYNEQHLRLLTSVAGQAAIAIENARLFEQIQARARRERILREVTAKVRSGADADTVMRTAVSEIGRALGRRTFVYLNEMDSQRTNGDKEESYGD